MELYPQALGFPFRPVHSAGLGCLLYGLGADQKETPFPNNSSIVACVFVASGTCLRNLCLAMNVYSCFTIPAFGHLFILCKTSDRCEPKLGSYFGAEPLPILNIIEVSLEVLEIKHADGQRETRLLHTLLILEVLRAVSEYTYQQNC